MNCGGARNFGLPGRGRRMEVAHIVKAAARGEQNCHPVHWRASRTHSLMLQVRDLALPNNVSFVALHAIRRRPELALPAVCGAAGCVDREGERGEWTEGCRGRACASSCQPAAHTLA